jgi:PAS domain-containing protein
LPSINSGLTYFGQRTPDEANPWLFAEFLPDRERAVWLNSLLSASRSHKSLELKLQLQSDRGHWEWFQVELAPDRDESGHITWIGTAIRLGGAAAIPDAPGERLLHRQRLRQRQPQQSPQFLEALLANASDGIVACDANGHLVLFKIASNMPTLSTKRLLLSQVFANLISLVKKIVEGETISSTRINSLA